MCNVGAMFVFLRRTKNAWNKKDDIWFCCIDFYIFVSLTVHRESDINIYAKISGVPQI